MIKAVGGSIQLGSEAWGSNGCQPAQCGQSQVSCAAGECVRDQFSLGRAAPPFLIVECASKTVVIRAQPA